MIPLSYFINDRSKKKFITLRKQVSSLELMVNNARSVANRRISTLSSVVSYITLNTHLHDMVLNDFDDCFANYFENGEFYSKPLHEKIIEDFSNKKPIFINVCVGGYGFNPESRYHNHGISIIFQPTNNGYKGIIINSHGHDITTEIDFIVSSTRLRTVYYEEGVDVALMRKMVKYINTHLHSDTIKYIGDGNDTYLGCNLQCRDVRGHCYMFPPILYYYYYNYYSEPRKMEDITIEPSSQLLCEGNVNKFVYGVFAEFSARFKEIVIETKNSGENAEELEAIIMSQDYRFTKDVLSPYLSFLRQ